MKLDFNAKHYLTGNTQTKNVSRFAGKKLLATDPHRNTQTKEVLGRFAAKKYKNLGRGFSPEGFTKFE